MQILFSEHFKKQLRKLKKKYPHVKDDFLKIVDAFNPNNEISIRLERSGSPSHQVPGGLSFGRSIYKIRVPSLDMQKGKSGGFRSYLYLYIRKNLLLPLCIYSKSETENISKNELKYHFDQIMWEIVESL